MSYNKLNASCRLICEEFGVCNPEIPGSLRIPGETSGKAKKIIHSTNLEKYIQTRAAEILAGELIKKLTNRKGRLSTLEEDLVKGIDYIIYDENGREIHIDFTRGDKGYAAKMARQKKGKQSSPTVIIKLHGKQIMGFIIALNELKQIEGLLQRMETYFEKHGKRILDSIFDTSTLK